MTVLAVDGTALFRHRPTGVDRYARGLVTALAQVRPEWEIRIARWRTPDPVPLPLVTSGRATVHESFLPRRAHLVADLARLPLPFDVATRTRADVWLFPDFVPLPLRHRAPSVTVVHDLSFRRQERAGHRLHRAYLERSVHAAAGRSRIATLTDFTRGEISQAYALAPDEVGVVRPGIDLGRFRTCDPAPVRERLGLDRPYVLSVGALSARKNLLRLVEAFARLGPLVEGVDLVLAGSAGADGAGVLEAVRAHRGPGRVRHLGYLDDDDLPALYAGAAVTAVPSVYEGFGIPVVEAMACGSPVVAARGHAVEEAAAGAALLVDPHDVGSISDGLRRVLADPSLARDLRARGLERARTAGWDASAEDMARLLERALERAPGRVVR